MLPLTDEQQKNIKSPSDQTYITLCYTFGFMTAAMRGEIPEDKNGKLFTRKNIEVWLESRPSCAHMDIARIINLAKSILKYLERFGVTDASIRPMRALLEERRRAREKEKAEAVEAENQKEKKKKKAAW